MSRVPPSVVVNLLVALCVAGCAMWTSPPRPSAKLLVLADQLAADGNHVEALEVYEQIVTKYPETDEARHARSSRDALTEMLAARAQIAKLTTAMKAQEAELARVRGLVAARDGDLVRARQEITRLTEETERLRTDLEQLKRIDIGIERRRK